MEASKGKAGAELDAANARVAELEAELEASKQAQADPLAAATSAAASADQKVVEARLAAAYYCPGCGIPKDYPGECVGTPTAPHAAIERVSTDELKGDPAKLTAAPATG